MILKTLSRKSNTGQLVQYICRYIFKDEGKNLNASTDNKFILKHNIRSRSLDGFIKEFRVNEAYRLVHRKDSVKLFHNILSFSPTSTSYINDKMLKEIFKKFVQERGSNNLYVGTKHCDKDHIHLHIAVSGTQLNGRSSRISKQKLHHIKIELDKYQKEKYPELIDSLPEHGKGKKLNKEAVLQKIKGAREVNKQSIYTSLETAYTTANSLDHFLSNLKTFEQEPYYRNNRLQGIWYQGKKYRLNRMGFDETALSKLDIVKTNEERNLSELKNLRYGNNELERSVVETNGIDTFSTKDDNIFSELAAIRRVSGERGLSPSRCIT